MKVKLFNSLIIPSLFVLVCANNGLGGVALNEEFDTDLSKWVVLGEPNNPTGTAEATVSLTGWGELEVTQTNFNDRWRCQGVQSIEQYPMPEGGTLVVDFYGTNHSIWKTSGYCNPYWTVASYESTGYFNTGIDPADGGWFSVKGWNAYYHDWVQWLGIPGGYYEIPVVNPEDPPIPYWISLTNNTFKHVIIAIDANFINVYIEDDFYENLSSPTSLYSVDTNDVFTVAELASGLYVYVIEQEYVNFGYETGELFDGVKVTRVGATSPMNCYEAMDMGYGIDSADINKDCRHDFYDLELIAQDWMEDVNP